MNAPATTRPKPLDVHRDPQQIAIPALFMRGGSSRGAFFLEDDLPKDPHERAAVMLACYGSPDRRQIDGIGGADPLTSKAAVVGLSARDDADLTYTFHQVGIETTMVSTGGNCGNMLSAVGPFAILRGLITAKEPTTSVRIYTTNTDQIVTAQFDTSGGYPTVVGDTSVPGVPGTGATITLDFGDCTGSVSGKLLPTGSVMDTIDIDGASVQVSFVDAATPFVFILADAIGAIGAELPADMAGDAALMNKLEAVRGWAATVLGVVADPALARSQSPNIPRVIMVSRPQAYETSKGVLDPADMDICVRQLSMQKPHNTFAVTGAICTAVASQIPGTVVEGLCTPDGAKTRLGHPGGVLNVSAQLSTSGETWQIESAAIERTARLIMAGDIMIARQQLEMLKPRAKT